MFYRAKKTVLATLLLVLSSAACAQQMSFPAFTVGNPQAETKIEFYLSPTCTMCAGTFRNTIMSLINKANMRKDLFLFVGVMPRSENDLKFARVMSCVPQAQLMPYMTEWYFHQRTASAADLTRLLRIGENYGIIGSNESECTSERNDKAFLSFNQLVFTENRIKEVPAIFVNGIHMKEIFYLWQFEEKLPQLEGK